MFILDTVPLAAYSTMRLGGMAAHLTEVNSRQEVQEAVMWAKERGLPVIMIGVGSNIVWRDEGFPGLVLINKIMGFESTDNGEQHYVTAGSGMLWDDFVARTVELGMTGVECLSKVPGTVGATPIQNVGAYGQEVSNSIMTIEAYDSRIQQMVTLRASDCDFRYRSSIFKTTAKGQYFITSVTFMLVSGKPAQPYYDAVQRYFNEHHISEITPATMREAVIAIRRAKLPDPAIVANNGSFFSNPIISMSEFIELQADWPDITHWITDDDRVKLSAAWLIEHAGFKDYHDAETGMATWPNQPLVLINDSAETTAQLLAFRDKIVNAIKAKFRVQLQQEPELLP